MLMLCFALYVIPSRKTTGQLYTRADHKLKFTPSAQLTFATSVVPDIIPISIAYPLPVRFTYQYLPLNLQPKQQSQVPPTN